MNNPNPGEVAALVARARKGEAGAFELLVRRYLRAAYAVALAVVGRPADAEDVAQDAWLTAFERLESCREPARFGGWLLRIVRNHALNFVDRRRLRDVPRGEGPPEAASEMARSEEIGLRGRLLDGLSRLTLQQREVVLLHDLEGWTHAEIAAALGTSEGMSRQHLFAARKQLRAFLKGEAPNELDHGS